MKISDLISDLLENYVRVEYSALKKRSMVGKLPRTLCDKIGNFAIRHPEDRRGMVDVGIEITKSMLERDRNTYKRFGKDSFLIQWMKQFIEYLNEELGDDFRNMRKIRDDVIIPVFKAEAIRNRDNFSRKTKKWRNKVNSYLETNEMATPEQIISSINLPKPFKFLVKKEEK